jgi:hypothetical protein
VVVEDFVKFWLRNLDATVVISITVWSYCEKNEMIESRLSMPANKVKSRPFIVLHSRKHKKLIKLLEAVPVKLTDEQRDTEACLDEKLPTFLSTSRESFTPEQWRHAREQYRLQVLYPNHHVAYLELYQQVDGFMALDRVEVLFSVNGRFGAASDQLFSDCVVQLTAEFSSEELRNFRFIYIESALDSAEPVSSGVRALSE